MKLPNYIKNNVFINIRRKMNIPKGYVTELESDLLHSKLDLKQVSFAQLETGRGLDVDLKSLKLGLIIL